MRFALFVAAALCGTLGCKGEPFRPDAADLPIDGPPKPPWFQPSAGEVKDWDIQLGGYDFGTTRKMIVVDLWDVVPSAQTITYDGGPTTIPVGSQPTAITDLHAKQTKVLCHVGTGAVRLDDPDIMRFPGYTAAPPNRPDPVGTSSIGWSTSTGDAMERFVDYGNASAQAVLLKRVELAKTIGCDGIVAFRNDQSAFMAPLETGFANRSPMQDKDWIVKLAKAGHDAMISVGGRGVLPNNVGEVKLEYDFLVVERCGELDDCDNFRSFIEVSRSVFGLDYTLSLSGAANNIDLFCPRWSDTMVDGIQKPAALDGTQPTKCP
jgi:Glycoside-hydrolase family GH114